MIEEMQMLLWRQSIGLICLLSGLLLIAIIPATIAQRKGYSFWIAYFFGVFSWVVAMFVVALLPSQKALRNIPVAPLPVQEIPDKCHNCGHKRFKQSRFCPNCGTEFYQEV